VKVWLPHPQGPELIGEAPPGVDVEVYPADPRPSDSAGVEVWAPPFLIDADSAAAMVAQLPDLRVVQLLTAGADAWIGRLPEHVTLCDARGVHDSSTSEWILTAMLAYLRDFPAFARAQARREWAYQHTGELAGKRILILGAGSIGEAVARRLAAFDVEVVRVARTARAGVHPVAELPRLLPTADVVIVIVPLTPDTTGMVDAAFLAAMPDGALLVNAARGPVVQTAALTAEVVSGRLGLATDVTDPEPLPPDHPLWTLDNVLITPHVAASVTGLLPRAYRMVGEQIRRYAAGQPLANVVTDGY
jgi:phosphoglycerate dehydrogenase-like enzyme